MQCAIQGLLNLTACKRGIWFLESGKFLLVESGIREIFAFGIRNPGLLNPECSSRIRNRTKSHLESRIQVPLTETGIQYLESGIRGVKSRIQECLGFPNMGRSTLSKRKDEPLPSRNIRFESQTRRAIYVSVTELNAMERRKRK